MIIFKFIVDIILRRNDWYRRDQGSGLVVGFVVAVLFRVVSKRLSWCSVISVVPTVPFVVVLVT